MSYLGQPPRFGEYAVKTLTGNGSLTSFSLDHSVPSDASIIVTIDGVRQHVGSYSAAGTAVLDFGAGNPPANGTSIEVVHLGLEATLNTPADGSVTSSKIVDGTIVNADINASAAIDATKIADGSVTSAEFQHINTLSANAQTQISNTVTVANAALPKAGGTMSGETIFADQLITRPIIKDYAETVYIGGNTSTSLTFFETNGNVQLWTLTGNCVFTMPSGSGLKAGTSLTIIFTQDSTGGRTGTFTGVKWAGGTGPTLTTTANTGIDIITFYTFNGGASPVWYGFLSGAAMA